MAADWSYLPADLAVLVAQRLTVYADHVRFGAACTTWRSAARAGDGRPRAFLPYLFDEFVLSGDTVAFHCLSDGEILHAPFPKLDGVVRCIASSKGWLLVSNNQDRVFLFDPLSNSRVDLPSTAYFPKFSIELGCVSSDGSRTVMVSYFDCQDLKCRLAYARPEDEAWTPIPFRLSQACDSLHHHEGKFYVVERTGEVLAIEIDTPRASVEAKLVAPALSYYQARKYIAFTPSGEMVLFFAPTWNSLSKPPVFTPFLLVDGEGSGGRKAWKRVDDEQLLRDVQVFQSHCSVFSVPRSIFSNPISGLVPPWDGWLDCFANLSDVQLPAAGDDDLLAVGVAPTPYMWFEPKCK